MFARGGGIKLRPRFKTYRCFYLMGPFERGIKEINIPLKYIVEVHLLKKKHQS